MRAFFRKTAFALLLLFAVGGSLVLDFFLPEHATTLITGSEVKLADKDGPISKQNPADQPLRDIYLIYTQHAIDDVRVYRNEDTGWGWPFYFKFDSSDVQATALALKNAKQPAYITTYGWRINMFSQYPNITAIRLAVAGESTWCAVRWLAFALWAVLLLVLGRLAWRLTRPVVKDGDVIG
jgi:hypothetical protein